MNLRTITAAALALAALTACGSSTTASATTTADSKHTAAPSPAGTSAAAATPAAQMHLKRAVGHDIVAWRHTHTFAPTTDVRNAFSVVAGDTVRGEYAACEIDLDHGYFAAAVLRTGETAPAPGEYRAGVYRPAGSKKATDETQCFRALHSLGVHVGK